MLNMISTGLCVVGTIFFMIGCIGYSDDNDTVKNVAWITTEENSINAYYGLSTIYLHSDSYGGVSVSGQYSDCTDDGDCSSCEEDGKGAFALTLIATVLSAVTLALCGSQIAGANSGAQIGSIITSILSTIAGIIALGLFMGDCYDRLDDSATSDLKWGPGAALTIIAMFLMALTAILQIIGAISGGGGDAKAPAQV